MTAERRVYALPNGKWGWDLTVDGVAIAVDATSGYDTEDQARNVADGITAGKFKAAKRAIER